MKSLKSGKLRERFNKTANNHREFKLADQIQKELARLFHLEVKDPRITFITITDVELTIDLSLAKADCVHIRGLYPYLLVTGSQHFAHMLSVSFDT